MKTKKTLKCNWCNRSHPVGSKIGKVHRGRFNREHREIRDYNNW